MSHVDFILHDHAVQCCVVHDLAVVEELPNDEDIRPECQHF